MAILIPDSCPSRATAGEKRLYALLRDALPDGFTAWYEADVAGRYPDFVLAADDFGLLVLEAKGWYAGQIARATPEEVELCRGDGDATRVEVHRHPTRQAREYAFALVDELARPEYAILRQPDGEHRGKPCFPIGYGIALTNITRAQLDEAGLSPLFPPERAICRDELLALESAGDRAVLTRLRRLFPACFPFDPLTEDQFRTLKGALHREVVVRRRPATADSVPRGRPLMPGAVTLDVLDAQQEQAARSLGAGHRVLFGIAGSGKTVLLLARARMLAARDPRARVLVLCYNKALAASLTTQLGDDPGIRNVEARHFDSWLARLTRLRKGGDESWEDFRGRMVAALLAASGSIGEAEKYDAVLIDEAHDFEADWFRCATAMLKGGPEGDLLIALDGAQSLYRRDRSFTWKGVGVQAVGRSRRLDRNYRNTKPILEFAWQVAQSPLAVEEETETSVRVLPRKAARRGPLPAYRACLTAAEERAVIARLVEDLKARGLPDREIAVLYPANVRGRVDCLAEALGRSGPVCWFSAVEGGEALRRAMAGPGVRLSTIHAAKGLEFRAVVVAALDLLPSPMAPDVATDSRLFYVGLTRATDELYVTWAGRSEFTDRVLRSSKASPFGEEA